MVFDTERLKVAHLLRRAAFGYTPAELDQYAALGFAATLDRLLNPERVDDSATDQVAPPLALDPTDQTTRKQIEPAKLWWFSRMLTTQRPLREKMALFWHGHFATADSKVKNAPLMLQQMQLFRDHGMGNFETLLQQVTRDPAMLIWLDNRENRKAAPNENYAREVMELFTVGLGNYSEDDVKEGARAFTGYTLDRTFASIFRPATHDAGQKTFMGQTGAFDADDVLGILLRQPATARFITTKLFRYFVHDAPEASPIDRLASTFTSSNFDIRATLHDLFTGPEFLSAAAFHGVIKQPVDFVAGAIKALGTQNVGAEAVQALRAMGQDLLNPPDVSGWHGGQAWINAGTLFERFNLAERLATGRDPSKPLYTDVPGQVSALGIQDAASLVDHYLDVLTDGDLTPEARQALVEYVNADGGPSFGADGLDLKARGLVHLAMAVPSYQLA
jgi:uncharacterized protein (DUF1800 family)